MSSVDLCFYCDRSTFCPFHARVLAAIIDLRGYSQEVKIQVVECSMFTTTSPNYPPKEDSKR